MENFNTFHLGNTHDTYKQETRPEQQPVKHD